MQAEHDEPAGLRIAIAGAFINGGLALVKLVAGILGNSYALIADAVESMADISGSLVVWGGIRLAHRPPDERHPYGHGKAEPLAALVVAMMLVGAAVGIAIQAAREILAPLQAPAPFTLWVLLGVIATKEILYHVGSRAAAGADSSALMADAWHHRADSITSLAAAIGISVAIVGGAGYEAADDWAALFASLVILYNASRIARGPVEELMDSHPAGLGSRIGDIARTVEGVSDVEKILARKHGRGYLIDMHLEVDPEMSVRRAHHIAHTVKAAVIAQLPAVIDVLVHVEPDRGSPNPDPQPNGP